jgi:hypothetical protein
MLRSLVLAMAVAMPIFSGCAAQTGDVSSSEPVDSTSQAMSRCGYPPHRPWPTGCTFTCVCTEPVNAPFGEDPNDYHCYGGTCQLEPRADCGFELNCR